jgi:hypothetical protein
VSFKEPQDRLSLGYNFFANVTLKASYESLLKKFTDRGDTVHYGVIKPDFFVISKTSPEGVDAYIRYHTDGNGILGSSPADEATRGPPVASGHVGGNQIELTSQTTPLVTSRYLACLARLKGRSRGCDRSRSA